MENQYIRILKESLYKKEELLTVLLQLTEEQSRIIAEESFHWERFQQILNEKELRIKDLNKMDEGFSLVFARVKETLEQEKELYRNDVCEMKEIIRRITDLSTSLEARERRNKSAMEQRMNTVRRECTQRTVPMDVATKRYEIGKKTREVTP